MSEWKPVTEPPAMYRDKLGIMRSAPALVYSKYRSRPPEMLIATLQSWGDGATPTWYSECPEDWNLHDSVLFWMPLPDPPRNMDYSVKAAEEALEKAMSDAKIKVEVYINATVRHLGLGLKHISQLPQIGALNVNDAVETIEVNNQNTNHQ